MLGIYVSMKTNFEHFAGPQETWGNPTVLTTIIFFVILLAYPAIMVWLGKRQT